MPFANGNRSAEINLFLLLGWGRWTLGLFVFGCSSILYMGWWLNPRPQGGLWPTMWLCHSVTKRSTMQKLIYVCSPCFAGSLMRVAASTLLVLMAVVAGGAQKTVMRLEGRSTTNISTEHLVKMDQRRPAGRGNARF